MFVFLLLSVCAVFVSFLDYERCVRQSVIECLCCFRLSDIKPVCCVCVLLCPNIVSFHKRIRCV